MRLKTLGVAVLCALVLNAGIALGSPVKHRVVPSKKAATVVRETTTQPPSMLVMDPVTSHILFEEHGYTQRAIASITKLMTALVFLDSAPDLTTRITITKADTLRASTTHLRPNDRVTMDDLLHLMLIASDNVAARVLARASGSDFVDRMNAKAEDLGLTQTHYVDPSGLLRDNLSSAYDMAHLITVVAANDYLTGIMQTAQYTVRTAKRVIPFHSTDRLLTYDDVDVMAAKTGFIGSSGFCFLSMLHMPEAKPYVVVVLGSWSSTARFDTAYLLLRWATDTGNRILAGPTIRYRLGGWCGPYPMTVSQTGQDFIKRYEGFHSNAYFDSRGYAIGYGMHRWLDKLVTKSYPGRVTMGMANLEFSRQLPAYQDVVERTVCAELSQANYDALVSVTYNLGRVNDVIIRRLASQQTPTIYDFLKTATVRKRPSPALRVRRTEEYAMFSAQY